MNSQEIANIVVIGGGVVGLAIAAEISSEFDDVFVFEAQPRVGLGASTRNSGVIHAGIYYRPGSLKAFHCVRGADLLYQFCSLHGVPHERIGKLIVADNEEDLPALIDLKRRGDANGVEGLEIIHGERIRELEPNVVSPLALYSPNTGIVGSEELVKTLARLARERGAHILTDSPVTGATIDNRTAILRTPREEVRARLVVNAGGLFSDRIARMFGYHRHTIYPCRGEYAEINRRRASLVKRLIYPLPMPSGHGLGIHFTKNTAGDLLLGPNARYIEDKMDYESGRAELATFYEAAIRMVPALEMEDLRPGYTGIRARLLPEDDHSFADFVIGPDPQWPFVIHCIGIESPGLTSCLSIASSVRDEIRKII